VAFVREVDEVGQPVKTHPFNRLPVLPGSRKRTGLPAVLRDVLVAADAGLHGRDAGGRRYGSRAVAIQTIDAQVTGMAGVRERQRLPVLYG